MAITINGSGTITGISAGGYPDGTVTADDLASSLDLSGKTVTLPSGTGGKVLQIQEFVLTSQPFTNSEDSFVDVTGWSDTITAAASTNKIIIDISLGRVANNSSVFRHAVFRIMKSTDGGSSYSPIAVPTGTGNKLAATFVTLPPNNNAYGDSTAFRYIDTAGTTNEITYKLQWANQDTSTVYLNRGGGSESDSSDAVWTRTISTMYLTEVAA